jgi:orotate phosphoribosyltransferase
MDAVHGAALSIDAKRARLLEVIKQRSLRFGDFVLRSGKRSNFFLDGKGATLSAEGAALVGEVVFDAIRDLDVDAVGGLTLGADPIATAVSVESWRQGKPIDAFVVRKETKDHGMGDLIAGTLKPASRVAIVEDTVTTGSAIQAAIDAVRAAGHTIVKVIAIVDRQAGASERFASQGLDYGWIFTLEDLGVQQTLDDFPREFAEEQRRNAEELKALRLPTDVEPPTTFRP